MVSFNKYFVIVVLTFRFRLLYFIRCSMQRILKEYEILSSIFVVILKNSNYFDFRKYELKQKHDLIEKVIELNMNIKKFKKLKLFSIMFYSLSFQGFWNIQLIMLNNCKNVFWKNQTADKNFINSIIKKRRLPYETLWKN